MYSTNDMNPRNRKNLDHGHLRGRRVAVVVFSHYPSDPRPRREAETLVQLGMEVDVISIKQNSSDPGHEIFNGVNIVRVPLKHWRGGAFSYAFQYGSFILAAFVLLAFRTFTRRYSLVHVHNMPDVLVFSALIPKLSGARVMLDLHDPMPELMMTIFGLKQESFGVRLMKQLEKWSIRFADVVITPNIAFAKLFAARSCQTNKLHVVMNSPDENIFKYCESSQVVPPMRDGTKPFIIMYHGALVERHGLDIAVLAIEALKRSVPNAQLHIYGRPTPFFDGVMEMIQARGLQEAVQYLGAKSLDQIVEAIDGCDVGIIPNRQSVFTELNMPTRIFEYLARGKSVIVPRTTGIQDYFSREEIIFFEPGDADDLVQQLQYVFSQPGKVNEITSRGQAVYRAHRWNEERSKFVSVARELVGGDGGLRGGRKPLPEKSMKVAEPESSTIRSALSMEHNSR
jgi:glycosyltransferase involved in cell wall biosynthesis